MSTPSNPITQSSHWQRFRRVFCTHPAAVGESYFEHQRAALGFAASLSLTAAAAVVHAIIPALCQSTARDRIALLHERLQSRSKNPSA